MGPTLRAQCVHMPHTGCAAAYVRSGYCLCVSTCWVCPCARCSCAVVTLARLGVTILSVGWGVVRSSDSTWSGSAFFAPLSWAPAVAVSVVYSHPLQPRRFTRACPSAESSFPRAIPSALMRGHTHAQEGLPLLPTGIRVPREHAMRREGTSGSAKAQIRGHRSIAVGMPRADDPPNALRSPQRSSTGGRESRGHQRRPGRLVQQRTVPPSRPLKRCIDVLCQFLSGGQGARARSDAWVLDSVFFVTASTVVG